MLEGQGKLLFTLLGFLLALSLQAQEVKVDGGFIQDSLMIGEPVDFWITASYPQEMEMIFPDSNATFTGFEFNDKTYFPTSIRDGHAYDTAIYTLQSFEIDPVQYLSLNTLILTSSDSIQIPTATDSIFLKELAPFVSDSTKLKTNLDFSTIRLQFNYPLMYYIIGGVVVLLIIILILFGKRILRYFKLKKMEKEYRIFSEVFTSYVQKLKADPQPPIAENALSLWKKYHQRLDKVGFSTLTTKEILAYDFTNELEKPLKSIDRTVYGNKVQENIYQDFQLIEDFTDERFKKKIEEIKNGE